MDEQGKQGGEGHDSHRIERMDARLDSVAKDVEVLQADVSVLKTDVSVLKTDVGELKRDMVEVKVATQRAEKDIADMRVQMGSFQEQLESVVEMLTDVRTTITQLSEHTRAMTSATLEALAQLNFSRTYERRITRLEEAVFGKASGE